MTNPELMPQPPTGAEPGRSPGPVPTRDGHPPLTGEETLACDRLLDELLAELDGDTVRSLPARPATGPRCAAPHVEVA